MNLDYYLASLKQKEALKESEFIDLSEQQTDIFNQIEEIISDECPPMQSKSCADFGHCHKCWGWFLAHEYTNPKIRRFQDE